MECYPMAKVGGMGDVVGSLPIYLNKKEHLRADVVLPKYHNEWVLSQDWETIYSSKFNLDFTKREFEIQKCTSADLGYTLYGIDIPGLFDRSGVYADEEGRFYGDELVRVLAYQIAVLYWVRSFDNTADLILHCHDHHTGMIPFMLTQCYDFEDIAHIPTLFTIHNGRYQGIFDWNRLSLIPYFDLNNAGLLDWNGSINSLAAAIKCCWLFNTVSEGYLKELKTSADGLEPLILGESQKGFGILNGIDTAVWDPVVDAFLEHPLKRKLSAFKRKNKKDITKKAGLSATKPLFVFIGRLVYEKGADILPDFIHHLCSSGDASCILLGTGEPGIEEALQNLDATLDGFKAYITYDEALAHQLYAAMDFLLMPSRVEPCGLNQMFAMRYGGIPIVRKTGGLMDSVPDIEEDQGLGITFEYLDLHAMLHAARRALDLYQDKQKFEEQSIACAEQDFSWEKSTDEYTSLYEKLINQQL